MKKFLAALTMLTAIAQPAFAQSFSASPYGTGNVLPFAYQPAAPQNNKIAAGQSELNAFGLARGHSSAIDSNRPTATGGGSLGYNENLILNNY